MPESKRGFDTTRLERISTHFDHYVSRDQLAGWSCVVSRDNTIVWSGRGGYRDREAGLAVESDSVFRLYSMTKPVTSVAAMMLIEEGLINLNDPISEYLPAFSQQQVYQGGSSLAPALAPAARPIQVRHLLTHTSGLTYDFLHAHPVDAMYREAGFNWGDHRSANLAEACDLYASLPLLFHPGTEWNYSAATDVLGRLVEVVSGLTLDRFFQDRIFDPLGMVDTGFSPSSAQCNRLAALYKPDQNKRAIRDEAADRRARRAPTLLSGGGGLYGTLNDYQRFCQMLLNRGSLDGQQLLGSRTLDRMLQNHLPNGRLLSEFGRPLFSETDHAGMGFGLGFSVVERPADTPSLCSQGEAAWGGAASTAFWVDPREQLAVVFLTQLLPSSTWPIRHALRNLVYQALVD